MELNGKLWGLLLVLSLAQVGHAQLQCYICDDCPVVNSNTPLMHCDEDFFHSNGNTEPSTQTTTDMPTGFTTDMTTEMPTEMPSSSSTTTTEESTTVTHGTTEGTTTTTTSTTSTTTTEATTTSFTTTTTEGPTTSSNATEGSTTATNSSSSSTNTSTTSTTTLGSTSPTTTAEQSTGTTEASTPVKTTITSTVTQTTTNETSATENLPPTPSTGHPTSLIPTPPNPGREQVIDDTTKYNVNGTETDHGSTKPYIASSNFRLRQTRAVSEYSYHCFKINANNVNGTMTVQRGCSRVKATESVCGHWKEENPSMENVKCYPCSNNRCNGSTTLNISLGALALTLIAVFLQTK